MKSPALFITLLITTLFFACTKDDNNPDPTDDPKTNPYYFKFDFDGTNKSFSSGTPQYQSSSNNTVGGYQNTGVGSGNYIGLSFSVPFDDTITDSDVMGLKGRTIYFDDSLMTPELVYSETLDADLYYSVDTPDHNFYIKIDDVTFLKNDTTVFNPVKTYVIKGTCKAVMEQYFTSPATEKILSNGEFNFIVSRPDY